MIIIWGCIQQLLSVLIIYQSTQVCVSVCSFVFPVLAQLSGVLELVVRFLLFPVKGLILWLIHWSLLYFGVILSTIYYVMCIEQNRAS